MNLDQIPKVSLGSMVMHCMVRELYAGGYLSVESVYQQSLLHISTEGLVALELTDGSVNGDTICQRMFN